MLIIKTVKTIPSSDQKIALNALATRFRDASNYVSQIAFKLKDFSKNSLHHKVYKHLREKFGLPSQICCLCIRRVCDAYSHSKKSQVLFKSKTVPFDNRVFKIQLENKVVSLRSLVERIKIPFTFGDQSISGIIKTANLMLVRGNWMLAVCVEIESQPKIQTQKFLGVDLGIENIAALSNGKKFLGAKLKKLRKARQSRRAILQSVNTKNSKRSLRKLSGKESRFQKDVNHVISKSIVSTAKALGVGIALEDLKGITTKHTKKTVSSLRKALGGWAFYQLRSFISYKAEMAGIPVRIVNPAFTSQTCSKCFRCEKSNRKTRSKFECVSCGHRENADLNAAKNISRAAVNQPIALMKI